MDITESLWRVLFCSVETILAKTYLDIVWPREPGSTIKRDEIKSCLQTSIAVKRTELYNYLAAKKMMRDFSSELQKGPEAAQHRIFAETEFQSRMSEILKFQLEPFQKGYYLSL